MRHRHFMLFFLLFAWFVLLFSGWGCDSDTLADGDSDGDVIVDGDTDDVNAGDDPDGDVPDGDEDSPPDVDGDGDADPDAELDPDGDGPSDGDEPLDGDEDADPDGDIDEDDYPGEPIELTNIKLMENPTNVLSYFISWESEIPASTHLAVRCGDDFDRTYHSDTLTDKHNVFVMGLYDGASCTLDFVATAGDRLGRGMTVIDSVGPLPEGLPELTVTDYDPEKVKPGWTFTSFSRISDDFPDMAVAIDFQGRYRWYHFSGIVGGNGDHEIFKHGDGLIVGASEPQYFVSWEGQVHWNLAETAHHDLRMSPFNDNHILFMGNSSINCSTVEHSVNELNLDTMEVIWTWRSCEHITPRYQKWNWSHLNTIEPFPGERALLISSRDQDYVFRLNRDSDEIEWVLGVGGDFTMDTNDYFLRQHAPEILPNGHILLFDNGLSAGEANNEDYAEMIREFSRVLEFELSFNADGTPDRADVVWRYVDETLFAVNRSEADRLDNGNTLIVYVRVPPDYKVTIREVTMDKEIVWNVQTPVAHHSYRVERMTPYFGHVK